MTENLQGKTMETDLARQACSLRAIDGGRCPEVSVVIVNYKTADHVIDCLHSLAAEADTVALQVLLVDNASPDDSVVRLKACIAAQGWEQWVELLVAPGNDGFAAGNNIAIRRMLAAAETPRYVLLLNPDTVVQVGAIRRMVAFLDAHPRAGIVGCRLVNPDGTPQRSAFRFPGVASELEKGLRLGVVSRLLSRAVVAPLPRAEAHETDWVSGACLLLRRAVLEQVGLLDEGFFLYFEEVDLCRRARAAGWQCWYVPEGRVVHLVGQATGMGETRTAQRIPPYWLAARRRYFHKHLGRFQTLAADIVWSIGHASWRLRRWIQRKHDPDPPHLLADFVRYNLLTRHPAINKEVIR